MLPYLRGQVEPQIAAASQVVLHKQRDLVAKADLDLVGEGRGLAEVDKILEREGQRHGLAQLNLDVLLGLLDVGVAAQRDGPVADVALAREFDAVLARLNGDYGLAKAPTSVA